MSGVGPLLPAGLEQAAGAARFEHPLQQALVRAAGEQAAAELAQDAEVEAGVAQLQAEQIFPVDARPHRVGGLAVAQPFAELQERHQRQSPRRVGRLPALGIKIIEVAVRKDRAEVVAQRQVRVALWKGGPGDTSRFCRDRRRWWLGMERHDSASKPFARVNICVAPQSRALRQPIGIQRRLAPISRPVYRFICLK
jgi:hypothetical protein